MKHILATTLGITLLAAAAGVTAGERTVTLSVKNMTCVSCPYIVKKSLTRVDGVKAVDVSLEKQQAVVRYDDARTNAAALTAATTKNGFPSSVIE